MEPRVELRQPIEIVGSLETSHVWVTGVAPDNEAFRVEPQLHPYSYWAECECPGDCLRDHENE